MIAVHDGAGDQDSSASSLDYLTLKDKQEEIISTVLKGRDIFGVLPTGYGKTVCFACLSIPFHLFDKEAGHPIVSPLKALIEDQVSL